jgi:hypothetical protein
MYLRIIFFMTCFICGSLLPTKLEQDFPEVLREAGALLQASSPANLRLTLSADELAEVLNPTSIVPAERVDSLAPVPTLLSKLEEFFSYVRVSVDEKRRPILHIQASR